MDRFTKNIMLSYLIKINNGRRNTKKRRVFKQRVDFFAEFDDESFVQRFRLSKSTVQFVLSKIKDKIQHITSRNKAITPEQMLLLTLRFYASGSFLIVVSDFTGVSVASASRTIKKVSFAIGKLCSEFIRFPDKEQGVSELKLSFHRIAKFPQVIGCIDCTHIRIQSPGGESAEVFRNRKGHFSFNVQGVCDANLVFLDIVCRWPGSAHDSNIFNNSRLKARLENKEFPHCFILGDSGYAVSDFMMTPLSNPTSEAERLYNESQIRTRNCIERCFGVWKRRFPILTLGIRVSTETTMAIVVATAVLHNISRIFNEADPPDSQTYTGYDTEENEGNQTDRNIFSAKRSALIRDYFARL